MTHTMFNSPPAVALNQGWIMWSVDLSCIGVCLEANQAICLNWLLTDFLPPHGEQTKPIKKKHKGLMHMWTRP